MRSDSLRVEDPLADAGTLPAAQRQRVFVVGASGTIGRATVAELVSLGHEVVCFTRRNHRATWELRFPEIELRYGDVNDQNSIRRDGFAGEKFNAVISCMASRTGTPRDAWAIDHRAHSLILAAAKEAGVGQMVLLSAICVQKPTLAFQQAKLAFEAELMASGLTWSIVRPTATSNRFPDSWTVCERASPSLCSEMDGSPRANP